MTTLGDAVAFEGAPIETEPRSVVPPRRALARLLHDWTAMAGAGILLVIVASALLAPWLAPKDPNATSLLETFQKPLSDGHLLGTDDLGRDVLSRLLYASRISLASSFGAVAFALVIAVPLGVLAGYIGRKVDTVIMAGVDLLLSFPPLILVFVIAGILGPSLRNIIVAIGVFFVPVFVRLVRDEVRDARRSQLVEAEQAVGVPTRFIIWRHVLPRILPSLIVQASLSVAIGVIAEASLSFLGLGVEAPTPSWGGMLRFAFTFVSAHAWMVFVPGMAIVITVFALNVLGDGLRDAVVDK